MTEPQPFRPSVAHAELGDAFFDVVEPAVFPTLTLRHRDDRWAARIGLDSLTDEEWLEHMGRMAPFAGSHPRPLALRYHGHQFRSYNPDLGDGRGFLLAQLHDLQDGRLLDLGTKGSGRTPYSRGGDGRLTLKGAIREILATRMLEALGVYTSKTLSVVETGEALIRNDEPSPTRSAVLVRLSHSHIRIGTFQRLAFHDDAPNLGRLRDYSIRNYLPEAWRDDETARTVAFLDEVVSRVAKLGAQWTVAGFVHGVLNTDNINITGESFDYGPWRFLPVLDRSFTAAYFDHSGLYAFGRQPETLLWNLTRLAECLLPLSSEDALIAVLKQFSPRFEAALRAALLRRLGVASAGGEKDAALVQAWFSSLQQSKVPFEQAFFDWYGGLARSGHAAASPVATAYQEEAFAPVRTALAGFEPAPGNAGDHPYFAGSAPCTMLIEEVEAIWAPIAASDDWSRLEAKLAAIDEMQGAYGS
ncbi:MAG: YdiU family protein [Acetobacteraceae bacterium]|nr:YdiU family protein [Acetobacteraceae bacterium]